MTEGLSDMLKGVLGGGGGTGSNVLGSLLKVVGSQGGGLGGLLSKFTGGGNQALADKAQSWVGTGQNQAVSGDEVEQALGSDTVTQVAQDAGVSTDEAKTNLADQLPQLIDKATPNGSMPDASQLPEQLRRLLGH